MRIVFLCSSLEPGRDGVGDYTRRLAEECIRNQHPCAIVALNDRHLSGSLESGAGESGLATLRLGVDLPWSSRVQLAREFSDRFQPDWLSLQFVGYGYANKGIVAGLGDKLRPIIGARDLHVMLHELWIGGEPDSSFKEGVIGRVQRYFLLRMLEKLRPAPIHTNLPTHRAFLNAAGIQCSLLPLFGNIPVEPLRESDCFADWIPPAARDTVLAGTKPLWVGGFFGSWYPEWKPEPLMGILRRVAEKAGRRLCLAAVGRMGTVGDALWERLGREYGGEVLFVKAGEQPSDRISRLLQLLDFGIPSAPWHLLGKSGAAAAMLDHGLPILVAPDPRPGAGIYEAGPLRKDLIYRIDETLESQLRIGVAKAGPSESLPQIAAAFVASLTHEKQRPGVTTRPEASVMK